jgi:hypothetical protein
MRFMNTPSQPSPRIWSSTATFVLLAFLAIGTVQLGGRQVAGAAICFGLAAAYLPLRVLRVRLQRARERR